MLKMICFDMDGTIADFYAVKNWQEALANENPTPYEVARPLWDMERLAEVLTFMRGAGVEIRVVTWLAKDSTEAYKTEVREAKLAWLEEMGFPFDNFHGVQYSATKADSVRKYLADDETAILIDDNAKVRKGWRLGKTIDPAGCDLIDVLYAILGEVLEGSF